MRPQSTARRAPPACPPYRRVALHHQTLALMCAQDGKKVGSGGSARVQALAQQDETSACSHIHLALAISAAPNLHSRGCHFSVMPRQCVA